MNKRGLFFKFGFLFLLCTTFIVNQIIGQKNNKFSIQGNVDGLKDGVHLYLTTNMGKDTVTQTISKNGKFVFTGTVPLEANFYFIKVDTTILSKPSKALLLVNDLIRVNGSIREWPDIQVVGSLPHDEYSALIKSHAVIKKEENELWKKKFMEGEVALDKLDRAKKSQDSVRIKEMIDTINKIEKIYEPLIESTQSRIKDLYLTYIHQHPNSLYISNLILKSESFLKIEGMKAEYKKLTKKAKSSYFGKQLKTRLDLGDASLDLGTVAPRFSGVTPNGEKLGLEQILKEGKFTLLDFWASWCSPCRAETPNVRKVYDLYHDKGFNVLSVTRDYKEVAWKQAIAKDSMTWYHMTDDKSGTICKMYKINAIPATFLLDANGKIIATDLRGEALVKKISELFD